MQSSIARRSGTEKAGARPSPRRTSGALLLVVRAVHPLVARTRITLRELVDWPWVAQPVTSPARVLFEEELARAGLATPVNLTECASIFATLQLLENYDAIAMLPESVVRDYVRGGLLVALPLEIGKSLAGFGILTRKQEPLADPALRLIELLRGFSRNLARDNILDMPAPITPASAATIN